MTFNFKNKEYTLLILHIGGSRLYGNFNSDSDYDYRGVFIQAKNNYLINEKLLESLGGDLREDNLGDALYASLIKAGLKLKKTNDIVLYDIKYFLKMAADAKPNVLDIMFHDYNSSNNIYINNIGKKILDNKELFISKLFKYTFNGYANRELNNIKNYNKFTMEFPDSKAVYFKLVEAYYIGQINTKFISRYFGNVLSNFIKNNIVQKENLDDSSKYITLEQLINQLKKHLDIQSYIMPNIINYIIPKDIKLNKLELDNIINGYSINDYILSKGAFKKLLNNTYLLFSGGNGIISENYIKSSSTELDKIENSEFICILNINLEKFRSDTSYLQKMWSHKIMKRSRNKSTVSCLGYETKNAGHLIRLSLSCIRLFKENIYTPVLNNKDLLIINNIKEGKLSFDELISYYNKLEIELEKEFLSSNLKQEVDHSKINSLLIEVFEESFNSNIQKEIAFNCNFE